VRCNFFSLIFFHRISWVAAGMLIQQFIDRVGEMTQSAIGLISIGFVVIAASFI
jgi:hypothetical protein